MVVVSQSTFASGILKTLTLTFITISCICALVYMGHMNDPPHHKRTHHRARRRHHNKSDHSGGNGSHHDSKNAALEKAIKEVNNIHGSDNKALEKELVDNLEALKAKAGYVYIDKDEKKHPNNGDGHHDKNHDDDHEYDDDDEDDEDDDDGEEDDEDDDYDYGSHFIHGL